MSIEQVRDLLKKQKLVETMVHGQAVPRQDVVETMVHRQHLSELEALLAKLDARGAGEVLESLSIEDAREVWKWIAPNRRNDILWEIPDALREQLVDDEDSDFAESQLNAFELVNGRLRQITITRRRDLEGLKPLWVDLVNASAVERRYLGAHFGVDLPDPGDTTDLEVSSRFYLEENGDLHLHSNFLLDREGASRSVPVAFLVHAGMLFTLRNEELPVFRLQRRRALSRPGYVDDCLDLLIDLYGADVEYSADSLEDIYKTLSAIGNQVLSQRLTDQEAAEVLARIAEEEDLNGRIRGNILDTQRALAFLMQSRLLSQTQVNDARQTLRNIESLNSHTAFLFDKINFLMDSTIGFININQNRRVSQLTAFGVVFMPLNILAGIGGMSEYTMMTQGIPWPIAYGAFVVGMGLVGWATYVALRHYEARRMSQTARKRPLEDD